MDLTTKINELVNNLNKWRQEYYSGNPTIPDEKFDFEERKLKELDPNNSYFDKVGDKSENIGTNIEHKIPMLSMQKVQTVDEAIKWMFEISSIHSLKLSKNIGIWIEPKIDGIAGKIVYDNKGNLKYITTRGDGLIGAIIPFGDKITGIPKKFVKNSEIRGEFYIPKRLNKLYPKGTLRNTCSGLLKRKEATDEISNVHFVMYDFHLYDKEIDFKDRKDKLEKLEKELISYGNIDYDIVPVEKTSDIQEFYDKYVNSLRSKWQYETDGLVLTVDGSQENYNIINNKYKITTFNRYNMALKPPAVYAQSIIKDIAVYVNRTKISFVAIIDTIYIGGTEINRASLKNYAYIEENNIGIGTKVLVRRTNDILPEIVEAYNEPDSDIKKISLKRCPICKQPLIRNNKELTCVNEYGCSGIYESKLMDLLIKFDVKNIGPRTVKAFVKCMQEDNIDFTFYNFFKIIMSKKLDDYLTRLFKSPDTLKSISFKKSLENLFYSMTEIKLLSAFNIPLIGEMTLIKHGIKDFEGFYSYYEDLKNANIQNSVFDYTILKWMSDKTHRKDLEKTHDLLKNKFIKEDLISRTGTITYCISGEIPGFRNKSDFIKHVNNLNKDYIYMKDVTLDTNFLITTETSTIKVMKAKKYNITIMNPDKFLNYIIK